MHPLSFELVEVSMPRLELARAGYLPGPPAHITPATLAIDDACCAELSCERCGTRGLGLEPFGKAASYRVLAVCNACGEQQEV